MVPSGFILFPFTLLPFSLSPRSGRKILENSARLVLDPKRWSGPRRGLRGGSWINNDPANCSCSYRHHNEPGNQNNQVGLRVVWLGGSVRKEMGQLDAKVAATQARLLKIEAREGQLWLSPDPRATTKEPVLITVSATGEVIERFDRPGERKQFTPGGAGAGLGNCLAALKPSDHYVLFLIRPSGITLFKNLAEQARARGYEIGFDALTETQEIHFTQAPKFDEPETSIASQAQPTRGRPANPGWCPARKPYRRHPHSAGAGVTAAHTCRQEILVAKVA